MRIAIIGYGRMGKQIASAALAGGHTISHQIDLNNKEEIQKLKGNTDVAIEFSLPESAPENIISCLQQNIPVVSGTTGWKERHQEIKDLTKTLNGTFLWASNFSIGVQMLFALNRKLATLMNRYADYRPELQEIHHIHKKDAPSGTALSLAEELVQGLDRINGWAFVGEAGPSQLPVQAIREGEVTGTHLIKYRCDNDILTLKHEALNRTGFVRGALLAAEYIQNRKGVFSMQDVLEA